MESTIDRPAVADEIIDSAEVRDGKPLVRYGATEKALAELRQRYAGVQYDLTTTAGDKAARAARLELVSLRTTLEKRRKEFKAPALELGKMIDAEASRITAEIVALETPIDSQIKADEARRAAEKAAKEKADAERKAKLQAGVDSVTAFIRMAQQPGMTAERLAKGVTMLEGMAFPPEQWQDYTEAAVKAHADALAYLKSAHAGAVERESEAARLAAERAELERMRELQRQEEARLEALRLEAERAAELAEQQRIAAEHAQLERERIAHLMDGVPKMEGETPELTTQPAASLPVAQQEVAGNLLQSEPVALPFTPSDPTVAEPVAEGIESPDDATGRDVLDAPRTQPTLKGGDICARLGFTLQAVFIAEVLGVPWSSRDGAAKLWHEADFPRIKAALIKHVEAAQ
jgi:hypothetical protein